MTKGVLANAGIKPFRNFTMKCAQNELFAFLDEKYKDSHHVKIARSRVMRSSSLQLPPSNFSPLRVTRGRDD